MAMHYYANPGHCPPEKAKALCNVKTFDSATTGKESVTCKNCLKKLAKLKAENLLRKP